MQSEIIIRGARQHNLKDLTVRIPKNQLVVLTGLSGSGKSTLAFEILHKEGQRQFMESMGMVTHLSKPKVTGIEGLSPTISVDQHLTNRSPRSTVGTETEVYTFLRVLFAKIGHRNCPRCGGDVPPPHDLSAGEWDEPGDDELDETAGTEASYPCPHCGQPMAELTMGHFSFNKPVGACPTCTGLGVVMGANLEMLIDFDRSVAGGAVLQWEAVSIPRYIGTLQAAAQRYGFSFDPDQPVGLYGQVQRDLLLHGVESPQFRRHYPEIDPPTTAYAGRFEGIVTNLMRRYSERIEDAKYREKLGRFLSEQTCPDCRGERIRAESRAVTVAGKRIIQLAKEPLSAVAEWIERLPGIVGAEELAIVEPVVADLAERIRRLVRIGVGYLNLERHSPTLSAGEAQRLRLAALLGSGLTGVLYVLDEPTIGLHQRDTALLIDTLRELRDLGNTVLVIEHDMEMVQAADHVIDMGPGAGVLGGEVVAAGTVAEVRADAGSITGRFLSGAETVPVPPARRPGNGGKLTVEGARAHNLRNLTVSLPLGTLTAVTGVSGSGKSSLMFDILDAAARRRFHGAKDEPGPHDRITGWEHLDEVITIDQAAIGRTTRSNAATYTDVFNGIRKAFASTEEASRLGLTEGHFSFNVPGGRCEKCQGAGVLTISMHLLSDVLVRCPACRGRRFKPEVLGVRYKGHSIADVLEMTIDQALPVFREVPAAYSRLALMAEVGMGYLKLGQPATTLSGGEAQRVKLAKELGRRASGRTLYLLDEPTTGLHPADTANLLKVLQGLVESGNTVVVIEHNLDLVKAADWVIDLGPEGGSAGGALIAAGTPEQVAAVADSHTGRYLRRLL